MTRYGAAKVLKVCGLLILCGLLLATLFPYLVTATLGFLLVGFGISSSVPICYSIAGKLGTVKASIAITIVLIYFPCIATIAAIKGETGSWKWAGFAAIYTTVLAWIVSALVFQIGSLL